MTASGRALADRARRGCGNRKPRRRRSRTAKDLRSVDALGDAGHGKVESRGSPHCAGRNIVAWGRANGLARYRCKSCGRTFGVATKNLPNSLGWRCALEAWGDQAAPQNWIPGAMAMGPYQWLTQ